MPSILSRAENETRISPMIWVMTPDHGIAEKSLDTVCRQQRDQDDWHGTDG